MIVYDLGLMEENVIQLNGGIMATVWNPDTCSCENGKYLAIITDDSVITCEGIM